jgi:DNA repair protein RadC
MNAPGTKAARRRQHAIADLHAADSPSPRHRLLAGHGESLSNREILAALLGDARCLDLATRLLGDAGLSRLIGCGALELAHQGAPKNATARLLAAYELAKRLAAEDLQAQSIRLETPGEVAHYLVLQHGRANQQVVGALYLDVHHRPLSSATFYIGTLGRAAFEPRAIVEQALLLDAPCVIAFHTRPSGDLRPSSEELLFNRQLQKACTIVGVDLLDHLLIAHDRRWFSLSSHGSSNLPESSG